MVPGGGVHVRLTAPEVAARAATRFVGAARGPVGVTALDAADSGPVPTALTPATVNVYAVPLVSPVTTLLVAVAGTPVTVCTTVVPARTVIVKLVSGGIAADEVQFTVAWALPATAVPMTGAAGRPIATVWSVNRRRSTLRSVSTPS